MKIFQFIKFIFYLNFAVFEPTEKHVLKHVLDGVP